MEFDIAIHNGTVLTVNGDFDIIEDGVIGIRGEKIVHIGSGSDRSIISGAKYLIDADKGIVTPGLVNTHTHLPMSLFAGLADDLPLKQWLEETIFPAEAAYVTPEFVKQATLLSCAEIILSGTTTCCDGYFYEGHVASAIETSGLRAVAGQGIVDFPAPGVANPVDNVDHAIRFVKEWAGRSETVTPSVFCHSPYTCSADTLKKAKAAARRYNVLFQIHAAETRFEADLIRSQHGVSPISYLDRLDVLDGDTLLAHTIWVDEADIDIISRTNAGVSVTTESEMKLGSGIAPVPDFLKAGVVVGIGTDGRASNNNQDLFEEMDFTAKLHKVNTLNPTVMDARTVMRLATIDGARAIGLGGVTGSIEIGKQADIIIVDVRKPHLAPLYNPVSQIVYSAKGADVKDVLVAGRPIMRNRKVLTLDVDEIMNKAVEIGNRIKRREIES